MCPPLTDRLIGGSACYLPAGVGRFLPVLDCSRTDTDFDARKRKQVQPVGVTIDDMEYPNQDEIRSLCTQQSYEPE